MTSGPLVSVGVPVYNGEQFLARTLESLLAQTYTHLEVTVCDNASTDATEKVGRWFAERDHRVRYVRHAANIGMIANFQQTLQLANGKYFMWNSADDVRPPQAIEHCVRALEQDGETVMVHGPIELHVPKDGVSTRADNRMDLHRGRPSERVRDFTAGIQHVGMLFGLYRREVLADVPFGTHVGGDYLVCLQMCQRGAVIWVPGPILIYRHRYGALDNPMYPRAPITIRDLLLHRGLRRRKCWMVLGIGCYKLWRQGARHGTRERVATVLAFVTSFAARFRPNLATELVYLTFSPVSWVLAPFVPIGRKLRSLAGPAPS